MTDDELDELCENPKGPKGLKHVNRGDIFCSKEMLEDIRNCTPKQKFIEERKHGSSK